MMLKQQQQQQHRAHTGAHTLAEEKRERRAAAATAVMCFRPVTSRMPASLRRAPARTPQLSSGKDRTLHPPPPYTPQSRHGAACKPPESVQLQHAVRKKRTNSELCYRSFRVGSCWMLGFVGAIFL